MKYTSFVYTIYYPPLEWTVYTGTLPTGMPKSLDKQSSFYLSVLLLVSLGVDVTGVEVAGFRAFSDQLLQRDAACLEQVHQNVGMAQQFCSLSRETLHDLLNVMIG